MKRFTTIALTLSLTALFGLAAEPVKKVLCTTFPLHGITRNVTKGSADLSVELLLTKVSSVGQTPGYPRNNRSG